VTRPRIALVDYGAGNLTSVAKGLRAAGADVRLAAVPADLDDAAAIVVPGVGHFDATAPLDAAWREVMTTRVERGRPLFGICLGMQWLFEGSDEAPGVPGLGVFGGRCQRLTGDVKVPHVGWNTLDFTGAATGLLAGIAPGEYAYFTHSFAAPVTAESKAVTTHGVPFAAVVERGLVAGVQFHPEKSGRAGLRLLENFVQSAGR
jgi:glutamine amidotransferase